MPFFKSSDGVRLKYELEGDGPSLLLHLGAGCDSGLWREAGYIEPLARLFRCVLFDHRGHGESDRVRGPDAHHIDRYASDVVALLDELELEETGYWGYSNGIAIGLKVADDYPGRLRAMVGSGTFGRPVSDQQALLASIEHALDDLRQHGWEKMIAGFDEQESEPVPEWMKDRIRATDIGQNIDFVAARPNWKWATWDALPRVQTPCLFLAGELEDPEDITGEAAAIMPNASRYRVPGLGHINAFLHSDAVLPVALPFLAKNLNR